MNELLERQKYAQMLKDDIKILSETIKLFDGTDAELAETKTRLKELKITLSNYDIYQQKIVYRCRVCNEVDCVCYTFIPPPEMPQDKEFENKINKLF